MKTAPVSALSGRELVSGPLVLQALAWTIGLSILTGLARFLVTSFQVGIQGMVVGGFCGAITGRLLAERPWMMATFGQRVRLAFGLAMAYLFGQFLGAGLTLPVFDPGFFLNALWEGDFREVVTGSSRYSNTSFQEPVEPLWWTIFMVLDFCLFAFLAMALINAMAQPQEEGETEEAANADQEEALEEEEESAEQAVPGTPRRRRPAWFWGGIFVAGWGLLWVSSGEAVGHNRAALRQWYEEHWAHKTMLDLRLHLSDLPVIPGAREKVERILEEALIPKHSFPEGYAIRAGLRVKEKDLSGALSDLEEGLRQAETLRRPVTLHPLEKVGPAFVRANLEQARALALIGLGRNEEAEAALSRALEHYAAEKPVGGASAFLAPAGLYRELLGEDLFPHQSAYFREGGLPWGFGRARTYLTRAALRAARGDEAGAAEDRAAAQQLGAASE